MNRPTSLFIVSTTLDSGGAERFASTLLANLDRTRVQPELVLLRDAIGYPLPDDICMHQLGYGGLRHLPGAIRRLSKIIRERKPDVVLSNTTATNLVAGLALPYGAQRPRWIARIGANPSLQDSSLRRLIARYVYSRSGAVVANSQGLAGEVREQFPEVADRVTVIENPTDFARLDQQTQLPPSYLRTGDRPVLIAAGRLSPEKRYDVMLDAMAIIRKHVDAQLWICGEGPERTRIERQAKLLALGDAVRLLGFCRNPHAVLKQADMFLLTSDHEGSPNALIEAQGLGIPAVSTRCDYGPNEIIVDGTTGLLVPTRDAQSLADAILRLLRSPGERSKMGQAARESVRQKFDAQSLASQWTDLVQHVVKPTNQQVASGV